MISFRPHFGQHSIQRFDVQAPPCHFGRPAVLGVQLVETGGLAPGAVDPVDGVALGLADPLLSLTAGPRNIPVVFTPGLVDQFLALLLGLVDLVEGGPDRVRGSYILKDNLGHSDAGLVLIAKGLKLFLDGLGQLRPTHGQNLVYGPVTDDFAHDGLRHVSKGLGYVSDPEAIVKGVGDAVLNTPFHHGDVEIAGQHQGFFPKIERRILGSYPRHFGSEPIFLFQLALRGDVVHPLDTEGNLHVQPGAHGTVVLTQPENDPFTVRFHLKPGRKEENRSQKDCNQWEDFQAAQVWKLQILQIDVVVRIHGLPPFLVLESAPRSLRSAGRGFTAGIVLDYDRYLQAILPCSGEKLNG